MSDTVKLNPCPKCGAPIPAEAPQGLCPKCVLVGAATATEAGLPATATAEIPSLERVAAAFPQLEILELIGRGGMGFVFKARQPHLDRFVALKLLPDKLARDPRFAERFNREGRVLAKLNHPNIVSVYDFGQTEHFYFLLMELVDGVNLRQAMKAGRFSPGEALAIVPKICEALQYAHGQGILHRDIKPENILLDAHGHVKIADFGIAKLVGEEKPDVALTATGASLGTPHYMAPEQLEHPLTVDHRADIYSLGVVFYEMLTGELPIGRFAAPSSKTPVGTAVDEVVFRTLEKDRERRYQSAGEMQTQVEHLAESDTAGAPPALSQAAPARPTHTHWARITGWIVVGLLLVNCFGPHLTRLGNSPANTFTIGLTTPWYVNLPRVDTNGETTREVRYNFGSSAFYSGIVGLLLCVVLLATRRSAGRLAQAPGAAALPVVPAWSHKAIWGAVLIGLSLPLPMLIAVLVYFTGAGLAGAELLLGAAAIGLPGLVGTLLGWMALSDLRAHQGRLRGLPLAVFAALAYPLLVLVGATLVIPWVLMHTSVSGRPSTGMTLLGLIVLLIPLGTITFGIWAVFAAARWGANKSPTRRRGVLKWVFLTMLFVVVAVVAGLNFLQGRAPQGTNEEASAPLEGFRTERAESTPWIRFTFTAVELRELEGARWLAIDYVDDVHGNCEKAFPWKTTIPGFKAETRTSAFLKQDQGSPQVRHQRIEYRMPDSAPREQLDKLRENLEQALQQKSIRLELSEQQAPVLLFELPGAEGGSLKAWVKVVPSLAVTSATPQPVGVLRLVAARHLQNLALFRFESAPAHPLHQIVARFSGSELPPEVALIRKASSGPYVVPSPDEEMNTPVTEPIVNGDPLATNQFPTASAMAVDCPGDYAFTFVLPDENLASEANRQLQEALAQPISLTAGQQIPLFTVGERKAWLEVRTFRPEPNKFAFFRHGGLSPALIPRSNYLENAVATIPPGHELQLVGRTGFNSRRQARPIFSTTLTSGPDRPGIYWLTWYSLPDPRTADRGEKEDWELVIHDPLGRELFRAQAPEESKRGWHRRWLGEPRSAKVGVPIHQQLFEKTEPPTTSDTGQRTISLEMVLKRSAATHPVGESGSPAAATATQSFAYGPSVMRTLSFNESMQDGFLDLDTGRLLTPPKDIAALFQTEFVTRQGWEHKSDQRAARMREWLQVSGAHLMVGGREHGERLEIREAVALAPTVVSNKVVVPFGFDQADANYLATRIKPMLVSTQKQRENSKTIWLLQPGFDPRLNTRQDSFCFRTRNGTVGMLQILNTVDNPPGLLIRYKLLQEVKTVPPPNVSTAPASATSDPKQPKASAELWAPKVAQFEEVKVSEVLREAERLAREGRFEEALQRHIWYHNHALEFDPAQTGVRLSFALSSWLKLAGRYPKAKEALIEIRDRVAQEFASGLGDAALFREVSSINQHLGQNDSTLALFQTVDSQNRGLAKQCYSIAEEFLVEKGYYTLCVSYIPNVQARFESIGKARAQLLEMAGRTQDGSALSNSANRTFIKDARRLVEILVAVGRQTEAGQIRDQGLAVLDAPELQSAVTDAERRVKSAAAARKL